jgi:two-component system, chemotaxis family, CheB/CheR fusion protein
MTESDDRTTREGNSQAAFPIVGIGASAGGLDAFKELLHALPRDTGMAYILVTHLPPSRESMLTEILARASSMPVIEARDHLKIEHNHIYVLPGGMDVQVREDSLAVTVRDAPAGHHQPIDFMLRSLAEWAGHRSIGVILSGTATDGTLGIQEIKAAGGITFAQDDTAQQLSMPQSAIATGAIDYVLPPAGIAHELSRIAGHPLVALNEAPPSDNSDLEPILAILRESAGLDFTHHKRNTLYRRIGRRMVLHRLNTLGEYVQMLKTNAAEVLALSKDMLINVTSFFRDAAAFESLKAEVFPRIAENRSRHDPVRVWVLACSTGEEAYSLAMAFAEFCDATGHELPLQVFATDLNEDSIVRARLGVYPRAAAQTLSGERLKRYFVEVDGHYQVVESIRERCVFARHNVLSDPPFSHVDLISCRNLLIYLDAELQQKLISLMHYGLRPNGYLWLGGSETVGARQELFNCENGQHKIYRKRGGVPRALDRPVTTTHAAAPAGTRLRFGKPDTPSAPAPQPGDIDRILVARYAPPSVLIREDLEILQFRGNTARYFAPAPGRASLNLLKMVREELVMGVRAAVQAARTQEMPARQNGLRLKIEDRECAVDVEVIPVRPGLQRAELFMVIFEDAPSRSPSVGAPAAAHAGTSDAATREIERLQQELSATREYLQSVIEQQEGANEALQAANEEVQSTNEELQSINEELETSKEEVQSSNEELATVNDELQARNAELAKSHDDFLNLLSSAELAVVMLDADLRIRRYTPTAEKLLNLIPTDIGRPLSDIKPNFDVPDIDTLISHAISTASTRERHVQDSRGIWYLLRILPYRTGAGRVEGAVIALIDVDSLKRSQDALVAADRHKDQFLAMLAHELRNPLAPLRSVVGLLKSPGIKDTDKAHALHMMERQISTLGRLIDDLLGPTGT